MAHQECQEPESPCTFCMKRPRPGRKGYTKIDNPNVTRFICEELKIDFDHILRESGDPFQHFQANNSVMIPLCTECTKLFFEMERIKTLYDEVRGQVRKLLLQIRYHVIEQDAFDETISPHCLELRNAIARYPDDETRGYGVCAEGQKQRMSRKCGKGSDSVIAIIHNLEENPIGTAEGDYAADIDRLDDTQIKIEVDNDLELEPEDVETFDINYDPGNSSQPETPMDFVQVSMNQSQSSFIKKEPISSKIKSEQCIGLESDEKRSIEEIQNEWKSRYINNRGQCRFCDMTSIYSRTIRYHEIEDHQDRLVYSCAVCDQNYSLAAIFDTHVQIHDTTGPYNCMICQVVCQNGYILEDHLIQHHVPKQPMMSRVFKANETKCIICSGNFRSNYVLAKHVRTMHGDEKQIYECELCPEKKFTNPALLLDHLVRCHESIESGKVLSCNKCSKQFVTNFMLQRHISNHRFDETKPLSCQVCERRFKQEDQLMLDNHMKSTHGSPQERRPNCTVPACNKSFPSQSKLRYHELKRHPELLIYRCKLCDKSYTVDKFLETHERTHYDIKSLGGSFRCSVCRSSPQFSTAKHLSDHLMKHTGEANMTCPKCSQIFKFKMELTRHMIKIHGSKKPWKCKVCSKEFIELASFKEHRELHEDPSELLKRGPKTCRRCGVAVATLAGLRNHIRSEHTPGYSNSKLCTICGKYVKHLKDHLRIHEGNKKYLCYFCSKGFVQRNAHLGHLYTHTKEKPYICSILSCNKEYNQAQCLSNHKKKVHG